MLPILLLGERSRQKKVSEKPSNPTSPVISLSAAIMSSAEPLHLQAPSANAEARVVSLQPGSGPNTVKDAGDIPSVLSAVPTMEQTPTPSPRQMNEDFDPSTHDTLYASIPARLREGTTMLKVSAKKVQRRLVKLKAEAGQLLWESKHAGMRKSRVSNSQSIIELRSASIA